MARVEDVDLDIAPIFNLSNDNYRRKFMPPVIRRENNEAAEEAGYRAARREKKERMAKKLKVFNKKYESKYQELELQVHDLARGGNMYGENLYKKYV